MVRLHAKGSALLTSLCLAFVFMIAEQYDPSGFTYLPKEELRPITAAYGLALDSYAAGNWSEAIRYLELSLRLRRLLKEGARYCALRCNETTHDEPSVTETNRDLRVYWHLLTRASCQKNCRALFPALQLPLPGRKILEDFTRRSPYRYLHFAYAKLNDMQRAIPCAYTFLQKNPYDQEMRQIMEGYKSVYGVRGHLTDYEALPYEASFRKGVKLSISGDYASSVQSMEDALRLYIREYELCQVDCEGVAHASPDQDLYTVLAGVYVDVLRCKLRCEENLRPVIGRYFVEKLVAAIYHYLQFAYYKLDDGRRAVPCAHSHVLFEPDGRVVKANLVYYEANRNKWGLQPEHFAPRTEALQHYNQIATQRQMLAFAEKNLQVDDEGALGPEEAESPDAEFEGLGDYEESIRANWRQEKGKGDAGSDGVGRVKRREQ